MKDNIPGKDIKHSKNTTLNYLEGEKLQNCKIIPGEYAENGEITEKQFSNLQHHCHQFDLKDPQVIIRSSEFSDFRDMIGIMPTNICKLDYQTILKNIKEVQNKLHKKYIKAFAQIDGSNFNPHDATIRIAPFLPGYLTTLTEHPNQKNVFLADKQDEYGNIIFAKNFNINDQLTIKNQRYFNIHKEISKICNFDKKDAIQYEILEYKNYFFLNQARVLAEKKYANFCLLNAISSDRVFGFTDPDGIELSFLSKEHYHYLDILLNTDKITKKYAFTGNSLPFSVRQEDYFASLNPTKIIENIGQIKDMLAFIPKISFQRSTSMSHNHSWIIQKVLKNWGIVFLDDHIKYFPKKTNIKYRFTCDGQSIKWEKA